MSNCVIRTLKGVRTKKLILIVFIIFIFGCYSNSSAKVPVVEYKAKGYSAAIDGNHLVINNFKDLVTVDLKTKKILNKINTTGEYGVLGFDIYGDTIVLSDLRNNGLASKEIEKSNADIFTYKISTGQIKQITQDKSAQMNPKIWRNYIIWQDNRSDKVREYPGKWSLYLYDLNTGKEKLITTTLAAHATYNIHDFQIVWEDERNFNGSNTIRGGDNVPENNKDIYLYDIKTGKEISIADGPYMESNPDIFKDYVVWEDRNKGSLQADIFLYNIKTKEKSQITDDRVNQGDPKVYGNNVVWMDERRGISSNDVYINGKAPNSDIFLYDLSTKSERRVTGDEVQIQPQISSDWLVFILSRQVNPEVQVVRYK